MDIVLEVLDYLFYDRAYAAIWPQPGLQTYTGGYNGTEVEKFGFNNYKYEPASQYISIQPGKWAYLSSWQRDSPSRQALSLFVTTW